MIVKELLNKYSTEEIIQRYSKIYNSKIESLQWLAEAIEKMRILDSSSKEYDHLYVIPIFEFDDNFEPHLELYMYDKNELDRFKLSYIKYNYLKILMLFKKIWFEFRVNHLKHIENIYEWFFKGPMLPIHYGIEFTPWNEVMQYEILCRNIEECGLSVICAILYEITFYGPDEQVIQEHGKHLAELSKHVKEHPEELIPWDKANECFEVEDGMTLKQKKESILKDYNICFINSMKHLSTLYSLRKEGFTCLG